MVIIEDDGPGFQKKRMEVFRAFYRVDESRFSKDGKTGLGLTIAKSIINGHGGDIILKRSILAV